MITRRTIIRNAHDKQLNYSEGGTMKLAVFVVAALVLVLWVGSVVVMQLDISEGLKRNIAGIGLFLGALAMFFIFRRGPSPSTKVKVIFNIIIVLVCLIALYLILGQYAWKDNVVDEKFRRYEKVGLAVLAGISFVVLADMQDFAHRRARFRNTIPDRHARFRRETRRTTG
jgi:heme/copper-type cytochrome/quinol oxidase subunit 4